jgi:hypothetical protein
MNAGILTRLLLLAMMVIVPQLSFATDPETNRSLKQQLTQLRKTRRVLEKHNAQSQRNNRKLENAIQRCRKELHPETIQPVQVASKKTAPLQQSGSHQPKGRKARLRHKIHSELKAIAELKTLKATLDTTHNSLKNQSQQLTRTATNYPVEKQKAILKLRKETLYSCRQHTDLKNSLYDKIELPQLNKLLSNAKTQNLEYSKLISQGGTKLIDKPLQFKNDIYKSLPKAPTADASQNTGAAGLQSIIQQFTDLRSKVHVSDNLLDTTSLPLNPYHRKPLRERVKPSVNFQFLPADRSQPSRMETALIFKFLISPQHRPFVGLSYAAGLGRGIENIRFSNQGVGTRIGYEYQVQPVIGLFSSYEYKIQMTIQDAALPPAPHRLILGATAAGKIYIGFNLLYKQGRTAESPFIFRIAI